MGNTFMPQLRKDLRGITRDRFALILALVFPPLLVGLFGLSVSFEATNLPIVIIDHDHTPLSRAYTDAFRQSLRFRVRIHQAPAKAEELLRAGTARAVLLIPRGFAEDFNRVKDSPVQLMVDAVDANTAKLMRADAVRINAEFLNREKRRGDLIHVRIFHNPGLSSQNYIVPGAIAFCLALFPPLLAALGVAREFEHRTIIQAHIAAVRPVHIVVSKVAAYGMLAVAESLLCFVVAGVLFGLWPRGDRIYFLLFTPLYLLGSASLGVMIGMIVKNATAAVQAVQFTGFVVSLVLAGLIFPVENIPASLRWVAYLVPARYYIELSRDVFLRPGGIGAIWHIPTALIVLCLLFCAIATASAGVSSIRDVA
jgi:ABC-2 type transport system permease protein